MVNSIQNSLFSWIDSALSQAIPAETVAFHFNLYEGIDSVHVQLTGTKTFDPGENPLTDYWPGPEVFSTGENIFEVPLTVAGADWQEWLKTLMDMVTTYLAQGAKSSILRDSSGVGIGFVDGDMHLLWQPDA